MSGSAAADGDARADLATVRHICGAFSQLFAGLEPYEHVIEEVQGAAVVWERELWPALDRLAALPAVQQPPPGETEGQVSSPRSDRGELASSTKPSVSPGGMSAGERAAKSAPTEMRPDDDTVGLVEPKTGEERPVPRSDHTALIERLNAESDTFTATDGYKPPLAVLLREAAAALAARESAPDGAHLTEPLDVIWHTLKESGYLDDPDYPEVERAWGQIVAAVSAPPAAPPAACIFPKCPCHPDRCQRLGERDPFALVRAERERDRLAAALADAQQALARAERRFDNLAAKAAALSGSVSPAGTQENTE